MTLPAARRKKQTPDDDQEDLGFLAMFMDYENDTEEQSTTSSNGVTQAIATITVAKQTTEAETSQAITPKPNSDEWKNRKDCDGSKDCSNSEDLGNDRDLGNSEDYISGADGGNSEDTYAGAKLGNSEDFDAADYENGKASGETTDFSNSNKIGIGFGRHCDNDFSNANDDDKCNEQANKNHANVVDSNFSLNSFFSGTPSIFTPATSQETQPTETQPTATQPAPKATTPQSDLSSTAVQQDAPLTTWLQTTQATTLQQTSQVTQATEVQQATQKTEVPQATQEDSRQPSTISTALATDLVITAHPKIDNSTSQAPSKGKPSKVAPQEEFLPANNLFEDLMLDFAIEDAEFAQQMMANADQKTKSDFEAIVAKHQQQAASNKALNQKLGFDQESKWLKVSVQLLLWSDYYHKGYYAIQPSHRKQGNHDAKAHSNNSNSKHQVILNCSNPLCFNIERILSNEAEANNLLSSLSNGVLQLPQSSLFLAEVYSLIYDYCNRELQQLLPKDQLEQLLIHLGFVRPLVQSESNGNLNTTNAHWQAMLNLPPLVAQNFRVADLHKYSNFHEQLTAWQRSPLSQNTQANQVNQAAQANQTYHPNQNNQPTIAQQLTPCMSQQQSVAPAHPQQQQSKVNSAATYQVNQYSTTPNRNTSSNFASDSSTSNQISNSTSESNSLYEQHSKFLNIDTKRSPRQQRRQQNELAQLEELSQQDELVQQQDLSQQEQLSPATAIPHKITQTKLQPSDVTQTQTSQTLFHQDNQSRYNSTHQESSAVVADAVVPAPKQSCKHDNLYLSTNNSPITINLSKLASLTATSHQGVAQQEVTQQETVQQETVAITKQVSNTNSLHDLLTNDFLIDTSELINFLLSRLSGLALAYYLLTPTEQELIDLIIDYSDPEQYDPENQWINYLYFYQHPMLAVLSALTAEPF